LIDRRLCLWRMNDIPLFSPSGVQKKRIQMIRDNLSSPTYNVDKRIAEAFIP